MKVLVLDNYDSFTYNLVQYLGELGAELHVVRNDRASVDELLDADYERCVVSPGPCTPVQAGGGTVADAKPEYEYEESVAKSRAAMRAVELACEQPDWA